MTGGCACGAVRFEAAGPFGPVLACHCVECRRMSGHFVAATFAPEAGLRLLSAETLRWWRSSARARRGFCGRCGSSLFWKEDGAAEIGLLAGALDAPTGLRLARHVFCAEKGDYYELADGLPRE